MCCPDFVKGRANKCCCFSVWLGIHLIAIIAGFEAFCWFSFFIYDAKNGIWSLPELFWFINSTLRVVFYAVMCCDGIHRRRNFYTIMLVTTILEITGFGIE